MAPLVIDWRAPPEEGRNEDQRDDDAVQLHYRVRRAAHAGPLRLEEHSLTIFDLTSRLQAVIGEQDALKRSLAEYGIKMDIVGLSH